MLLTIAITGRHAIEPIGEFCRGPGQSTTARDPDGGAGRHELSHSSPESSHDVTVAGFHARRLGIELPSAVIPTMAASTVLSTKFSGGFQSRPNRREVTFRKSSQMHFDDEASQPTNVSKSHGHAGHSHGLVRADEVAGISDARLLWAVGLNQLLTVGQVIAGLFSGSVALLSDAAHNFNDANALLIAYIARRISRKAANERYTFGYHRAEMIGALINLTLLAVIGLYLVVEGVKRLFRPEEIVGWMMAATAVLALAVDVGTAFLLWTMSHGSLNVRAAFVHNIVDALGSVAVLIGAAAIIWLNWLWVDAVITLLIAGYVLWQVIRMFPQATRVLMEGTPPDMNLDAMIADVTAVDGVAGLHHLHIWELSEQHRALEAHVLISASRTGDLEMIKRQVKACLSNHYGIRHSTLEFEVDGSADCADSLTIVPH